MSSWVGEWAFANRILKTQEDVPGWLPQALTGASGLVREVDEILGRAKEQDDIQVQSDYAKYLTIRLGGLVEQVTTEIVLTYVKGRTNQSVAGHVAWRMGTFQNPSMERLLQLVGSFGRERREQLEAAVTEAEREALGSVMAQRNRIAHGEPSTISLSQVADYFAELRSMLVHVAESF